MNYNKLETFNFIKHWNKLNQNKYCLIFKTKELHRDCMEHLEELGCIWRSKLKPTQMGYLKEECLFLRDKILTHADIDYAKVKGIQILNYKEW